MHFDWHRDWFRGENDAARVRQAAAQAPSLGFLEQDSPTVPEAWKDVTALTGPATKGAGTRPNQGGKEVPRRKVMKGP